METTKGGSVNETYETIDEFYLARGGRDEPEVDFGYDWHDGHARYRISWNEKTGDVFAVCVGSAPRAEFVLGGVELLASQILDVDTVRNALWLDEGDEESTAIRQEVSQDEDTTALSDANETLSTAVPWAAAEPTSAPVAASTTATVPSW